MITNDRLELAHWVVKSAKAEGASDIEVNISNSRSVEMEYRDGQLDVVKESTENSLNIALYVDGKYSGHSTNDLRQDSVGKFVRDAVAMTKYLSVDKFRKLPDPKYYRGMVETELDLIDDRYDSIRSDERVAMVKELQEMTSGLSDKILSSTAGYYDNISESIKVHSNGFEGVSAGTSFSYGVEVTLDDGKGGRPSDWNYATTRHLSDMEAPADMSKNVVKSALEKLGQEKIESGVYEMVVHNRAATQPIYALYSPLTGRSIQQKRSFLDGKLGEKLFSDKLTVIDDPFIKRGLGSRHYDGEGMATRKRTIIEKGVVKEFLIDNYYGNKLGVEPTGGSVSNVSFEYGDKSLDELIKQVTKGILVTNFIGGNSNGTTGDYSWGLVGMYIENGKIVKPVYEMNISGNLTDLWANLVECGNDPYEYSSFRRPSLYFKDVQFSGL